jgi:hypothetical protein
VDLLNYVSPPDVPADMTLAQYRQSRVRRPRRLHLHERASRAAARLRLTARRRSF